MMIAVSASAVCTQSGDVASSSTAIVGANDIKDIEGRHYLLIQKYGAHERDECGDWIWQRSDSERPLPCAGSELGDERTGTQAASRR
jgi:hypothetical protein